LAKHLHWPARYLAHEPHHDSIRCQFGNRGYIVEHQELLTASPAVFRPLRARAGGILAQAVVNVRADGA